VRSTPPLPLLLVPGITAITAKEEDEGGVVVVVVIVVVGGEEEPRLEGNHQSLRRQAVGCAPSAMKAVEG